MTKINRYSAVLIITAAIIVEVLGAAQYFMARHGAKQEMLAKAQRDIKESQRVASVRAEVETALSNAEPIVRMSLVNSETSYSIATRIIMVNPHIIGVGMAFTPNYYAKQGRKGLYMPYTFDDQPSIASKGKRIDPPHIQTRIPQLDYTKREWYKTAMDGQRQWTNAYVGEGGLNILMCTYSIPIKDKSGRTAAVLFADVTMEDATVLLNDMHSGIRKSGTVTLILQVLSLLFLGFIIWRAVTASRNYKAQMVDPEKEHLLEQLSKLREMNSRLTKRNQELAEKNVSLQRSLDSRPQVSDSHWFG